jgi:hypothetical protein
VTQREIDTLLAQLRRRERFWLRRELFSAVGVFIGIVLLAGVLTTAQASLPKPEVLSKSGNTPATPMSSQWAKDRKAFIAECKGNGGIPVVIAGPVGSDGIDCAQRLGE